MLSPVVLLIISIFILEIIVYQFLIIGTKKRLVNINNSIGKLQNEVRKLSNINKEIKKFKSQKLDMERKAIKFGELIPHTIDKASLLQGIQEIAEDNKVKNMVINFLPFKKTKGGLYKISIIISCEVKYGNLGKFLISLNNSHNLLTVEKLEIKRNPKILPYLNVNLIVSSFQSSSTS
jgi:Tfp pilus assembly protein PilO